VTDLISSRRTFLTGLGLALVCAPAIVRSTVIMPVKNMLILPDNIGDITFPLEGGAQFSQELSIHTDPNHPFYGLGSKNIAEFSHAKWSGKSDRPHHSIPLDVDDRWERMKAREKDSDPRLNKLALESEWYAFKKGATL
jgi:hypothetical protein